jgi:soluble P-type ATPase
MEVSFKAHATAARLGRRCDFNYVIILGGKLLKTVLHELLELLWLKVALISITRPTEINA